MRAFFGLPRIVILASLVTSNIIGLTLIWMEYCGVPPLIAYTWWLMALVSNATRLGKLARHIRSQEK